MLVNLGRQTAAWPAFFAWLLFALVFVAVAPILLMLSLVMHGVTGLAEAADALWRAPVAARTRRRYARERAAASRAETKPSGSSLGHLGGTPSDVASKAEERK